MSKSVSSANSRRTQSNSARSGISPRQHHGVSTRSPSAMSSAPPQPRSSSTNGYTRAQSLASEAMLMARPQTPTFGRLTTAIPQSDAPLPLLGAPESSQYCSHQRNAGDQSSHLLRFVQNRTAGTRFDLPTETFFTGRRVIKELRDVFARCFACVGETVWIGEKSGVLSVWDLKTGEQVSRRERQQKIFITSIMAVGLYVWVGYSNGILRVFNPESMLLLKEVKEHLGAINQILIAFNGLTVYTASADFTICQWDTANVERIASLNGHKNNVRCVVAAGGTRLFSAADDNCIIEWDMASAKPRHIIKSAHSKPIRCLTIASGHLWSGSEDGTVKIWSLSAAGGVALQEEQQQQQTTTTTTVTGNTRGGSVATSMGRGESMDNNQRQQRATSPSAGTRSLSPAGDGSYDVTSPAPKGGNSAPLRQDSQQAAVADNYMMTSPATLNSIFSEPPPLVHVISNPHTSVITHLHTVGSKVWSACLGTLFIWDSASFALEGQFNEHDGFVTALMAVHQSSVARVWTCGSEGTVKMWNSESQWTSAFRAAQEEHLQEMEALLNDALAREQRLIKANENYDDNMRVLSLENARIAGRVDELEGALEREKMHSMDLRKAIAKMEEEVSTQQREDKKRRDQAAIEDAKRAEQEEDRAIYLETGKVVSDDPLAKDLQRLLGRICRSSNHAPKGGNDTLDKMNDDFNDLNFDEVLENKKKKKVQFDTESYDALQKALQDLSLLNDYNDCPYSTNAGIAQEARAMDELEALSRWKRGDYGFGAPASGLRSTVGASRKTQSGDGISSGAGGNSSDRLASLLDGAGGVADIRYTIVENPDGSKTAHILPQEGEDLGAGTVGSEGSGPSTPGSPKSSLSHFGAKKKKLAGGGTGAGFGSLPLPQQQQESLSSRLTAQNNALRMELLALRAQVADLHHQAHLATTTGASTATSANFDSNHPSGATEVNVNAISEADLDTLMQIKGRAVECLKKEIAEREAANTRNFGTGTAGGSGGNNNNSGGGSGAAGGRDDDNMKAYYDALRDATSEVPTDSVKFIELRGRSTMKVGSAQTAPMYGSPGRHQPSISDFLRSASGKHSIQMNNVNAAVGPIPVTSSLPVEDRARLAVLRQKYSPVHQDSTVMCGEKEASIMASGGGGGGDMGGVAADGSSPVVGSPKAAVRWAAGAGMSRGSSPAGTGAATASSLSGNGPFVSSGPLQVSSSNHGVHLVAVMPPEDAFLVAKATRCVNGENPTNSSPNSSAQLENPLPSAAILGYLTVEELSPSEIKALERIVLEDRKRRYRKDPADETSSNNNHTDPSTPKTCSSIFFRPSNDGFSTNTGQIGVGLSPQRALSLATASESQRGGGAGGSASGGLVGAFNNKHQRTPADQDIDHLLHLQAVIDRTIPVGILLPPLHTLPEKELELVFMIYQRHRGTDYSKLLLLEEKRGALTEATELVDGGSNNNDVSSSPADAAIAGYSRVKEAQKRTKDASTTNAKAALKLLPNAIGGVRLSVDSIRADAEATLAEVLYETELTKQRLADLQAEIDNAHAVLDSHPSIRQLVANGGGGGGSPASARKSTANAGTSAGFYNNKKVSLASASTPFSSSPPRTSVVNVSSRAPYNSRWAPGGGGAGGGSVRQEQSVVSWGLGEDGQGSTSFHSESMGGAEYYPAIHNNVPELAGGNVDGGGNNNYKSFGNASTATGPLGARLEWLADAISNQQASASSADAVAVAQQGPLVDALRAVNRLCTTGSSTVPVRKASNIHASSSPPAASGTIPFNHNNTRTMATSSIGSAPSTAPLHISTSDENEDDSIGSDEVNEMIDNAREIITGRASSVAAQQTAGEVDPEVEAVKRRQEDFFEEMRMLLVKDPLQDQSNRNNSNSVSGGTAYARGDSQQSGGNDVSLRSAAARRAGGGGALPILNDNDKDKIDEAMQKALFLYRRKSAKRASLQGNTPRALEEAAKKKDGGASSTATAAAGKGDGLRRRSSFRRSSQTPLVPKTVDEEAVVHAAVVATTAAILAEKHNADQQQLRQALRQLDLLKGEASEESERSAQKKACEMAELKQQLAELRDDAQAQHDQRAINDDLRARLAGLQADLEDMYRQWRRRDYTKTQKSADDAEKRDRALLANNSTPKSLAAGVRVEPLGAGRPTDVASSGTGMAQRTPSNIRAGGAPVSEADEQRENRINELLEDATDQMSATKHEEALRAIQERIATHDRIPYTFLKHYPAKGVTLNDIIDRVLEDPSFKRHARDRNVFLRQRQEEERALAVARGGADIIPEMAQKPAGGGSAFKLRFTSNKGAAAAASTNKGGSGVTAASTEEDLARATRNLDESILRQEDALNNICTEIADAYRRNHLLKGFTEEPASDKKSRSSPVPVVTPDVVSVYARKLDAVRLDNVVLRQDLAESKSQFEALQKEIQSLRQRVEAEIPLHESSSAPQSLNATKRSTSSPAAGAGVSAGSAEGKLAREQKASHLALLNLAKEELKEIRSRDHTTFINTLLDIQQESPARKRVDAITTFNNSSSSPAANRVALPSDDAIQRASVVAASRRRQPGGSVAYGQHAIMDYPLDEAAQQAVDELYETEIALGLRREQRWAKQADKLQALLEREKLRSNRTEKDLDTADKEKARSDLVKKDRLEKENVTLQRTISLLESDLGDLRDQLSNTKEIVEQVQKSRKKLGEEHVRLKQEIEEQEEDGQFRFRVPPPRANSTADSTCSTPMDATLLAYAGGGGGNVDRHHSRSPHTSEDVRRGSSGQHAAVGSGNNSTGLSASPVPNLARQGSNASSREGSPSHEAEGGGGAGFASSRPRGGSRARSNSGRRVIIDERDNVIMDRSPSSGVSNNNNGGNNNQVGGYNNNNSGTGAGNQAGGGFNNNGAGSQAGGGNGNNNGGNNNQVGGYNNNSGTGAGNQAGGGFNNNGAGSQAGGGNGGNNNQVGGYNNNNGGSGNNQVGGYNNNGGTSAGNQAGGGSGNNNNSPSSRGRGTSNNTGDIPPLSPRRGVTNSSTGGDGSNYDDAVDDHDNEYHSGGGGNNSNSRTPTKQQLNNNSQQLQQRSPRHPSPLVSAREARNAEEALRVRLANTEKLLRNATGELRNLRNDEDEESRRRRAALGKGPSRYSMDDNTSEGEEDVLISDDDRHYSGGNNSSSPSKGNNKKSSGGAGDNNNNKSSSSGRKQNQHNLPTHRDGGRYIDDLDELEDHLGSSSGGTGTVRGGESRGLRALTRHAGVNTEEPYPTRTKKATGNVHFAHSQDNNAAAPTTTGGTIVPAARRKKPKKTFVDGSTNSPLDNGRNDDGEEVEFETSDEIAYDDEDNNNVNDNSGVAKDEDSVDENEYYVEDRRIIVPGSPKRKSRNNKNATNSSSSNTQSRNVTSSAAGANHSGDAAVGGYDDDDSDDNDVADGRGNYNNNNSSTSGKGGRPATARRRVNTVLDGLNDAQAGMHSVREDALIEEIESLNEQLEDLQAENDSRKVNMGELVGELDELRGIRDTLVERTVRLEQDVESSRIREDMLVDALDAAAVEQQQQQEGDEEYINENGEVVTVRGGASGGGFGSGSGSARTLAGASSSSSMPHRKSADVLASPETKKYVAHARQQAEELEVRNAELQLKLREKEREVNHMKNVLNNAAYPTSGSGSPTNSEKKRGDYGYNNNYHNYGAAGLPQQGGDEEGGANQTSSSSLANAGGGGGGGYSSQSGGTNTSHAGGSTKLPVGRTLDLDERALNQQQSPTSTTGGGGGGSDAKSGGNNNNNIHNRHRSHNNNNEEGDDSTTSVDNNGVRSSSPYSSGDYSNPTARRGVSNKPTPNTTVINNTTVTNRGPSVGAVQGGDVGEYRRFDDDFDHSIVDRYKKKNVTLTRQLAEALQTARVATEKFEEERAKNELAAAVAEQEYEKAARQFRKPAPQRDVDAERFNALVNQLEEEILNASVVSGFGDLGASTGGGGSGSALGGFSIPAGSGVGGRNNGGAGGAGGNANNKVALPFKTNAASVLSQQLTGDPKEVDNVIQMRRRDLHHALGMGIRNPTASKEKITEAFEEMTKYFTDREKRWKQLANMQNLSTTSTLKMLTESTELASKLRTLSYLFETRPILIRALYEINKLLTKTLKINNYHRRIVGNRPLTRTEALDQNTELTEEVEITKEGTRWIIANLFTSYELCHIGASPSMFIPDGRRPTWRDIVIPEKYQRVIAQASIIEEETHHHHHPANPPAASSSAPPTPQSRYPVGNFSVVSPLTEVPLGSPSPSLGGNGPHQVRTYNVTTSITSTPSRVSVSALGYSSNNTSPSSATRVGPPPPVSPTRRF